MIRNLTLIFSFAYLSIFSGNVFSWNILTEDIDLHCQQTSKQLNCDYRSLRAEPTPDIFAKSDDLELQVKNFQSSADKKNTAAILFLVDTSDPNRQNVIEKNKIHLKELLSTFKPGQQVGLASFDKSTQFISPVGTSTFLLSKSINTLRATGRTTELYRNLITAIEHLKTVKAKRKLIVLLSDGQAEDKAYFHSDVIKVARKHAVVINSIGYPRSTALSVALQTIRRISEETGGNYIETDISYNLPAGSLNTLNNNIDSGHPFSVELEPLYKKEVATEKVALTFKNSTNTRNINVPVTIKIAPQAIKKQIIPQQQKPEALKTPASNIDPPIQIITKQADNQAINLWLWYGLPAAFIVIIIFILITLFLLWHRRPEPNQAKSEYKPYAYLITNDEHKTRYPITRTIWRIGRSKDNELSLSDTSLSRRHAEIHRNTNGTFDIVDMNSMNGVYINNEKIGKAELHEGDIVEIGDVFLHFTQFASDHSLEESTVMQKTKVPVTH